MSSARLRQAKEALNLERQAKEALNLERQTKDVLNIERERLAAAESRVGMLASGAKTSSPDSHYYMVRREDNRMLWVTREILGCLFDLTMHQAAKALGICSTTAKRMRAWSGVERWPRNKIISGNHSDYTLESVRRIRSSLMKNAMGESDSCLFEVLATASMIAEENDAERAAAQSQRKRRRCKQADVVQEDVIMSGACESEPVMSGACEPEPVCHVYERVQESDHPAAPDCVQESYHPVALDGVPALPAVAQYPPPPAQDAYAVDLENVDFFGGLERFDYQSLYGVSAAAVDGLWSGWHDPI